MSLGIGMYHTHTETHQPARHFYTSISHPLVTLQVCMHMQLCRPWHTHSDVYMQLYMLAHTCIHIFVGVYWNIKAVCQKSDNSIFLSTFLTVCVSVFLSVCL